MAPGCDALKDGALKEQFKDCLRRRSATGYVERIPFSGRARHSVRAALTLEATAPMAGSRHRFGRSGAPGNAPLPGTPPSTPIGKPASWATSESSRYSPRPGWFPWRQSPCQARHFGL